jgi:hypothetical protein
VFHISTNQKWRPQITILKPCIQIDQSACQISKQDLSKSYRIISHLSGRLIEGSFYALLVMIESAKIDFPFRKDRVLHSPPPPPSPAQSNFQCMTKTKTTSATPTTRPTSNPTTPTTPTTAKHDYCNPTVYYVCRDFFAAKPEHLSVFIDDELEILEETNGGAWTRVRERDSQQIGLIPTDLLESGSERLAKQNKTTNQETIRVMSCRSSSSSHSGSNNSNQRSKKVVSFCESDPEILQYSPDTTHDNSIFPFSLDEDESSVEIKRKDKDLNDDGGGGGICSISDDVEMATTSTPTTSTLTTTTTTITTTTPNTTQSGFFARLFKRSSSTQEESEKHQITKSLHSFQDFPDHLIRVYTGNFDSVLGGYKTFIVDETLTFEEFSLMVLGTFGLEADGFRYELNLVNHLTAEIVPVDLNYTIEQVIELTKRTGLAFSGRMPSELRKAQKGALSRLKKRSETQRDKASDYVTPFKFVLNRIFAQNESVPLYVHVNLSANLENSNTDPTRNLIISSLFAATPHNQQQDGQTPKSKPKWYKRPFGWQKKKSADSSREEEQATAYQHLKRLCVKSTDHVHALVHDLLEALQVPETLPGIAFEAFLPAIHDAIELPLPMNMPVGEALKIRPRIDQAQQIIIIRPVPISSNDNT